LTVCDGKFNFVVFSTGVHPQDRSQLILQFRPPDLSEIIGPISSDLIRFANPGTQQRVATALQNLSNDDPVLSLISPDELQRQNMLEDVAQLMLDIDKLTRSSEQNITDMTLNDFKSAVPQVRDNFSVQADSSSHNNLPLS
ncbi:hypothetical protein COOONC_25721, partial [Cooperia oncophora]